jgi:uncharacterized RDD family membrane protein YckC
MPGLAGGGSLVGQLNYALWADRVLGAVIDGFVVMGVMVALFTILTIISMIFGAVSGAAGSDAAGGLGAVISSFSCCFAFVLIPISVFVGGLFNTVYLVSKRGSSIGQGVMGLKVVDAQGGLLPFGSAFVRLLARVGLGFIPIVGGFLDLLWPLWDEQRQTLHDKAVGSFVIKTQ